MSLLFSFVDQPLFGSVVLSLVPLLLFQGWPKHFFKLGFVIFHGVGDPRYLSDFFIFEAVVTQVQFAIKHVDSSMELNCQNLEVFERNEVPFHNQINRVE